MIKVTAETVGNHVELDAHMEGSAMELGVEMASIVTRLPEELIGKCKPAFHVMRAAMVSAMVSEMDEMMAKMHKDETDGEDNSIATHSSNCAGRSWLFGYYPL